MINSKILYLFQAQGEITMPDGTKMINPYCAIPFISIPVDSMTYILHCEFWERSFRVKHSFTVDNSGSPLGVDVAEIEVYMKGHDFLKHFKNIPLTERKYHLDLAVYWRGGSVGDPPVKPVPTEPTAD